MNKKLTVGTSKISVPTVLYNICFLSENIDYISCDGLRIFYKLIALDILIRLMCSALLTKVDAATVTECTAAAVF